MVPLSLQKGASFHKFTFSRLLYAYFLPKSHVQHPPTKAWVFRADRPFEVKAPTYIHLGCTDLWIHGFTLTMSKAHLLFPMCRPKVHDKYRLHHVWVHSAAWKNRHKDKGLSSRLTRPSHFPSVSFISFQQYGHLAWELPRWPNKKDTVSGVFLIWQLPILPGRFQPSTFGVCELNFRVRHGNGCILTAIATISEGCSFKTI